MYGVYMKYRAYAPFEDSDPNYSLLKSTVRKTKKEAEELMEQLKEQDVELWGKPSNYWVYKVERVLEDEV